MSEMPEMPEMPETDMPEPGSGTATPVAAPPAGTVERWAFDYVCGTELDEKLMPPPLPGAWQPDPEPLRLSAPGRPSELRLVAKRPRSLPPAKLENARHRAELVHAFLHHELQAAELMCWAFLAFPDAPRPFRRGLLGICLDEVRHMGLYREHLGRLGFAFGDFPVRDWFWQRVPQCATPLHYVALMGMGLEGGNLDHARRFARRFAAVGDLRGAEIQAQVADEEVAHVAFATRWFRAFTGGLDFARWVEEIVEPLTPAMLHGEPLNEKDRLRAGFTEAFLRELSAWDRGSPSS